MGISKLFLDTNVLLNGILQREGYEHTESLIRAGDNNLAEIWISPISISFVAYIGRKRMEEKELRRLLIRITSISRMANLDETMTLKVLQWGHKDIEDALQVYSAIASGCEAIVTGDLKFKVPPEHSIAILTSKEAIRKYKLSD